MSLPRAAGVHDAGGVGLCLGSGVFMFQSPALTRHVPAGFVIVSLLEARLPALPACFQSACWWVPLQSAVLVAVVVRMSLCRSLSRGLA